MAPLREQRSIWDHNSINLKDVKSVNSWDVIKNTQIRCSRPCALHWVGSGWRKNHCHQNICSHCHFGKKMNNPCTFLRKKQSDCGGVILCRDIKSVFLVSTSVHLGSWSNYQRPALAVPFAFSWNSYDTVITKDQTRSIFKELINHFLPRLVVWSSSSLPWALWWWVRSDIDSGSTKERSYIQRQDIFQRWYDMTRYLLKSYLPWYRNVVLFWRRLYKYYFLLPVVLLIKNNTYQILFIPIIFQQ